MFFCQSLSLLPLCFLLSLALQSLLLETFLFFLLPLLLLELASHTIFFLSLEPGLLFKSHSLPFLFFLTNALLLLARFFLFSETLALYSFLLFLAEALFFF